MILWWTKLVVVGPWSYWFIIIFHKFTWYYNDDVIGNCQVSLKSINFLKATCSPNLVNFFADKLPALGSSNTISIKVNEISLSSESRDLMTGSHHQYVWNGFQVNQQIHVNSLSNFGGHNRPLSIMIRKYHLISWIYRGYQCKTRKRSPYL